MRRDVDLVVAEAAELATLEPSTPAEDAPRTGAAMGDLGLLSPGSVAVHRGEIVAVGTPKEIDGRYRGRRVIDARGRLVTPGLVDPHTHPIFAAYRDHEFEMRVKGIPYQEIARQGGGIMSSARSLRKATPVRITEFVAPHLSRMLESGTTTIDAKSGYGLSLDTELRSLRVIKRLNQIQSVELVPTFLGAHAIPEEFKGRRAAYVRMVIEEMIPQVARSRMAEYCDVFCDEGAFTPHETERILKAGALVGLRPKLHADEFADTGGAELAARVGAVSADHLLRVSDAGIRALARAGVIGVLLPGTALTLGVPSYAPARALIAAGVPVALATDFNPGSCFTESMQIVIALACMQMRMTPAEALVAATVNAAHAIGRAHRVGSLRPGKQADLVVWDAPGYRHLAYHFGVNLARSVVKRGRVAVG